MRSRASLRLRRLKADRGPAAITHDEPHARATEKRQLIFAVGQSIPHPAAGVRHQGECILDSRRAQLHRRVVEHHRVRDARRLQRNPDGLGVPRLRPPRHLDDPGQHSPQPGQRMAAAVGHAPARHHRHVWRAGATGAVRTGDSPARRSGRPAASETGTAARGPAARLRSPSARAVRQPSAPRGSSWCSALWCGSCTGTPGSRPGTG